MKRLLIGTLLLLLYGSAAGSAARAEDKVRYNDRATKKDAEVTGTIQNETPGGIVIKPTIGNAREIGADDIIDIDYHVPGALIIDYRKATTNEKASETAPKEEDRQKALAVALKTYQELLPQISEEKAERHMEFKIAKLLARQAEEDPSLAAEAIDKLSKFKQDHPNSWQITACAQVLAQLQIAKKDYDLARKTYEDLAKTASISERTRRESERKIAQILVRAGKHAEAERKLQDLLKALPADDREATRLRISLTECQTAKGQFEQAQKMLEEILAKTSDNELKAMAYNALGDSYYAAKKPKDALWQYLWVDVIYHQNREEHARALYQLFKLFKELNDDKRAQECRERLAKDKKFAGLEYQRFAAEK